MRTKLGLRVFCGLCVAAAFVTVVWAAAGSASVGVRKSTALEAGAGRDALAAFTLRWTGSTAVTVNVQWGGTATNGIDYLPQPNAFLVPPGDAGRLIVVTAVDDTVPEGPESVTLTVLPGLGYSVGSPAQGTATIFSDE